MTERRSWPALVVASALTVSCAVVAGVGVSSAMTELTRGPSKQEQRAAAAEELARRWRTWPAGKIFPERLTYTSEQGGREVAGRVGIGPGTDCAAAVDVALRASMEAAGCRGVIRATYLDAVQGVVVTIGVGAFRDAAAVMAATTALPHEHRPSPGLRPLSFPKTATERFTAAGRQYGTYHRAGPYLVMVTAGQVDGRPAKALDRPLTSMFTFTDELSEQIARALVAPGPTSCRSEGFLC
ncbi:hypothetical protein [Herbidospora mongoliensis]|uniref:hypothetical protein n=1 Tax=Herbidospora mongoliensis TaxID=688067 RepID=UPI000AB1FB3B|nr:hypothetical protein [Herbidospora mongoliensis]